MHKIDGDRLGRLRRDSTIIEDQVVCHREEGRTAGNLLQATDAGGEQDQRKFGEDPNASQSPSKTVSVMNTSHRSLRSKLCI